LLQGTQRKLVPLKGRCVATISEIADPAIPARLNPSLVEMTPFPSGVPLVRCLQAFDNLGDPKPHTEWVNNLYVYPRDVAFKCVCPSPACPGNSDLVGGRRNFGFKAKNILTMVQLLKSDDTDIPIGLPAFYCGSSCEAFASEAFLPVSWHSNSPTYWSEIKLRLPNQV
jgi:hypothetical protein